MALGGAGGQQLIDILLRITAEPTGAIQANQALQQLNKQTDRLGGNFARAFTPQIIKSMDQGRQKLLQQGQATQELGTHIKGLSPRLSNLGRQLETIGKQQQGAAASNKINTDTIRAQSAAYSRASLTLSQFAQRTEAMSGFIRSLGGSAAISSREINLLSAQFARASGQASLFSRQLDKAKLSQGSFGGESTALQKAGQGMILSFSLSQIAAGNFEAGMFGLGFSLLFVGRQLLGWPLIIAGVTTALTVGLPHLIRWVKGGSDFEAVTERMSRRVEQLQAIVKELKGPLSELSEEFASLRESGGSAVLSITKLIQEQQRETEIDIEKQKSLGAAIEETAKRGIGGAFQILTGGPTGVDRDRETRQERINALLEIGTQRRQEISQAILQEAAALQQQAGALRAEIALEQERTTNIAKITDIFDIRNERNKKSADIRRKIVTDTRAAELREFQQGVQDRITSDRRAMEDQIDTLRAGLDIRIEAIRDQAKLETDISKARVDELKSQEKELVTEFNNLQRQRLSIIGDIHTTEAEVAALKRLIRQFGPDEDLLGDLAIREARLKALEEERQGIQDASEANEDKQKVLEDLIEAEEDLQETIKDNADEAVKIARDGMAGRVKEIRRGVEDAIALFQRESSESVRIFNERTREIIQGISDAEAATQRRIDKEKEIRLEMFEINSLQQQLNDVLEKTVSLREQAAFFARAESEQLAVLARIAPFVLAQRVSNIPEGVIQQRVIAALQIQNIPKGVINSILEEMGLPTFATGGIVPGPRGAPTLAVLHGGEEVKALPEPDRNKIVNIYIDRVDVNQPSDLRKLAKAVDKQQGRKASVNLRQRRFGTR